MHFSASTKPIMQKDDFVRSEQFLTFVKTVKAVFSGTDIGEAAEALEEPLTSFCKRIHEDVSPRLKKDNQLPLFEG